MNVLNALGTTVSEALRVVLILLNTIQIRRGVVFSEERNAFEQSSLLITLVLLGMRLDATAKNNYCSSRGAIKTCLRQCHSRH